MWTSRCSSSVAALLATLLIGLSPGAWGADPIEEFKAHVEVGLALYKGRYYEQAIKEFQAAYALQPLARLLFNLGQAHLKLGHGKEALEHYERYRHAEPNLGPDELRILDQATAEARVLIEAEEALRRQEAEEEEAQAEAERKKKEQARAEAERAEAEQAARAKAKAKAELMRAVAQQQAEEQRRRHPPWQERLGGYRAVALVGGQGYFYGTGPLFGGGLRVGGDHRHHLGWSADLLAHRGRTDTFLGEVFSETFVAGGALLFQHHLGRFDLRAGGGLRLGAARVVGRPTQPQKDLGGAVAGVHVGPLALLGAGLRLPAHLLLELSLEGGYVLTPVGARVDGARVVAIEGPWIGAQLGLGVTP